MATVSVCEAFGRDKKWKRERERKMVVRRGIALNANWYLNAWLMSMNTCLNLALYGLNRKITAYLCRLVYKMIFK